MTKLISTLEDLALVRKSVDHKSVGFVPTMGALHKGHGILLEKARQENDFVILSVFVNPTQFDNPKDLEKYPITLESDLKLAKDLKIDVLWTPTYQQLYPDHYQYRMTESQLSTKFCGVHRPGHFEGVLSVVLKLLNLVRPHRSYFGEKDYQQLELIRGMVKAFFVPTEIVSVPTVRDSTGLAMSSRNTRLNEDEIKIAPMIYQILKSSPSAEEAAQNLSELGFKVDYVEDYHQRRLAAVSLGSTRLIDNVEI